MSKQPKKHQHPKQYFDVLKMFHLIPDFKLTDFEKDVVKYIDKHGSQTTYDLADAFDLRPSEVKETVGALSEKGVLTTEAGDVALTEMAIKFIHAPKEERKAEKKFRKFLDTLDEKDLEKFLGMVNSFEVKEDVPEPEAPAEEEPEATEAKETEETEKGEE